MLDTGCSVFDFRYLVIMARHYVVVLLSVHLKPLIRNPNPVNPAIHEILYSFYDISFFTDL